MNKKLEYTATNTGRPFSLKEMIIGAKLKEEGFSAKNIKEKSITDNIFQAKSEHSKIKTASTVNMRLDTLDEFLIKKLSHTDIATAKQIIIYSIMKSDKFFFEFMNEIYKDKIILRDLQISQSDINIFISRKREQIPEISKWTEQTMKRLKSQYLTMLQAADFIKKSKNTIEIIQPILDQSLYNHLLEIGDKAYLQAMIGEI